MKGRPLDGFVPPRLAQGLTRPDPLTALHMEKLDPSGNWVAIAGKTPFSIGTLNYINRVPVQNGIFSIGKGRKRKNNLIFSLSQLSLSILLSSSALFLLCYLSTIVSLSSLYDDGTWVFEAVMVMDYSVLASVVGIFCFLIFGYDIGVSGGGANAFLEKFFPSIYIGTGNLYRLGRKINTAILMTNC